MSEINLGGLEFNRDDFSPKFEAIIRDRIASEANRLLRERLANAPLIYGPGPLPRDVPGDIAADYYTWCQLKDMEGLDTHIGRLICIEEIK